MQLDKIKELTNLLDYLGRLKIEVVDDGQLRLKDSYVKIATKRKAAELAEEINAAIEPILAKYESELRKELVACAKR